MLDLGWYDALLYWKLYSSTPDASLTNWLQGFSIARLRQLLTQMPQTISRQSELIMALVESIGRYQLPGMASSDALPVRQSQTGFHESPVRLIDMALWVERGAY